jgi:hypothetical protein
MVTRAHAPRQAAAAAAAGIMFEVDGVQPGAAAAAAEEEEVGPSPPAPPSAPHMRTMRLDLSGPLSRKRFAFFSQAL